MEDLEHYFGGSNDERILNSIKKNVERY